MNDTERAKRQERNQRLEALQARAEALLSESRFKREQYEKTVELWARVRDEAKLLERENEIDAEVERRLAEKGEA